MTTLHPQIQTALDALARANLPAIESLDPAAARELFDAMAKARGGEAPPVASADDLVVPGPAGDVPIRVYRPNGAGPFGAVLYFHGGGHVLGGLDTHDAIARNLCAGSEALVLSVGYRKGPEHRFPTAVEDAWAVMEWFAKTAEGLDGDPRRVAVAGDSAGGNLAAVVALMARDRGAPPIALQVLIYPVTDYGLVGDSYQAFAEGYGVLTPGAMAWFRDHYLGEAAQAADWRASPVRAASHAGVAPALILSAECDVLYDDAARYADVLRTAGVPVDHVVYGGMIHGFFGMTPDVDHAVDAQRRATAALRAALAGER